MKRQPAFESEAALCAAFIAWAQPQGWTAYNESSGWDILLAAADGTQIGVQAKLRFNLDVLSQAIEKSRASDSGPDFRVVLVPNGGASDICSALGLTQVSFTGSTMPRAMFFPDLPLLTRAYHYNDSAWQSCNYTKRHRLPDYVPDVAAGMSAPIQLTRWKVDALKVIALLELRGHVTRADFRRYGIDPRRWINYNDWLIAGVAPGQFVRGPRLKFDTQHPVVYAQIRAEIKAALALQTPLELT